MDITVSDISFPSCLTDCPPPPTYEEASCYSASIPCSDVDPSAWPSSYYRGTRRVDLARFYHDLLRQTQDMVAQPQPRVSFSTEPPMIHHYEPEYDSSDEDDEPLDPDQLLIESWPGRARPATAFRLLKAKYPLGSASWPPLDLRPVYNNDYKPVVNRASTPPPSASPPMSILFPSKPLVEEPQSVSFPPAPSSSSPISSPTSSPKTRRSSLLLKTLSRLRAATR